jgi:superfamily I DNA/RNA helicase
LLSIYLARARREWPRALNQAVRRNRDRFPDDFLFELTSLEMDAMVSQSVIPTVGDDADLQEIYDTERHLLYVAFTRARDHLLITSVEPASEFLDDLRA